MKGTFLERGGFRGLWVAETRADLVEVMDMGNSGHACTGGQGKAKVRWGDNKQ